MPEILNARFTRRTFLQGCSAAIAAMAGSRLSNIALAAPGSAYPSEEIPLVVFLRADPSQGTLLCALHDDGGALVPLMLLDERETPEVRTHAQRHHFTLT